MGICEGLETQGIIRRLTTLLAYHEKLVEENRNQRRLGIVQLSIRLLLARLEQFDGTIAKLERRERSGGSNVK